MIARALALAICLAALPTSATVVRHQALETLAQRSESIVHGYVRFVEPVDGRAMTALEIEVAQWVKGTGDATLRLEVPGGWLGKRRVRIAGVPEFAPGDEVVLLLERTPAGRLVFAGLGQGVFRVDAKRMTRAEVRGMTLVNEAGRLFVLRQTPLHLVELLKRLSP